MAIQRIESLLYGVEDVEQGIRYFEDWGLEPVEKGATGAVFRTQENQTVHVRAADDAGLPSSPETGSTLRETVWGVDGPDGLEEVAAELTTDRQITRDTDGTLHTADETGFGIGFRVMDRVAAKVAAPVLNVGEYTQRLNAPIEPDQRVAPIRIGHVVFGIPRAGCEEACNFYMDRLGFRLSERALDTGDFMRCEGALDHHSLFLAYARDRAAFGHCAFELPSFDHIMFGGKYMEEHGWKTRTRPGRHIMGSNLFWYFNCPCGGSTEYFCDMDRLDETWEPRIWDKNPGYAMWMLEDVQG